MMKFLFASDSFKGSLSSAEIHQLLSQAAREIFPNCETVSVPMADGGEGTMEAVVSAAGGSFRTVNVQGPLGNGQTDKTDASNLVSARYGILPGDTALVEMAEASGLYLVPEEKRDPRDTSTYGTGQLIRDALEQGARAVTIAIGGSATNDGGMGAMAALGVTFLDRDGKELAGCGKDLGRVETIDLSGIHPAVSETHFTVMCDVDNPLLGPDGAAWTFGAQKGASPAVQEELEAGMCHYAEVLQKTFGTDIKSAPGAGAAGGLGAALLVFLGAEMKSGVETVLELTDFDRVSEGAALVVTGEGRIDWQSAHGKVVSGVARHCAAKHIPVIAVVGGMGKNAEATYEAGISSIFTTSEGPAELSYVMEHAGELYLSAARRMFRVLRAGMLLREAE